MVSILSWRKGRVLKLGKHNRNERSFHLVDLLCLVIGSDQMLLETTGARGLFFHTPVNEVGMFAKRGVPNFSGCRLGARKSPPACCGPNHELFSATGRNAFISDAIRLFEPVTSNVSFTVFGRADRCGEASHLQASNQIREFFEWSNG